MAAWILSLAAVAALLVDPSEAHPVNDFYPVGRRWPVNITEDWVFDNNVPTGDFRDAVRFGLAEWDNGAGGNGPDFHEDGVITATNHFDPCDHARSVVWAYEDLASALGYPSETWLGYTPSCYNASVGGTFATHFQMTLEKTAAWGGASGWYMGTGSPGPNQWDLRSIAVHEAGHATGFYGHFSGAATCPSPPQPATWETMCSGTTALKSTTILRTRETHDLHTFNAAY